MPGSPLNLTDAYTYDAHGSMTSMPSLAVMEWDYADRLKHTRPVNGADPQDTFYTYDGAGQRVRKVFTHMGTLKERIYLGGYEVYRERANTTGSVVQFERQTLHVMNDQRRVAMVETKMREGGAAVSPLVTRWRFQLDNHLGSAMLELDEAGSVISYEEYHPYGSSAFSAADGAVQGSAKRYRYTGKERDEETGLYYHGARYYAPWLGRWTAADPAGMADGVNLYRYSRGNPIMFSDPGGTQAKPFADPGSVDYQVGTSTDPELIRNLKGMTAEQRGAFLSGATGKFQERVRANLRYANLGTSIAIPEITIEGARSSTFSAYAGDDASGGLPVVDAPHFAVAPPIPQYLVRKEYPELARSLQEAGILEPEVAPGKSSVTPVEHALNLHKAHPARPSPFLSVSENFPGGAERYGGDRLFINRGAAETAGAEYIPHEQLAEMVRQEHPDAQWLKTNPATEREGLFRGPIPGSAVEGRGTIALRYGARGLQVGAVAITAYNLTAATEESVRTGSVAPIAAQTVREAGGWGAAIAGAKIGAVVGAAVGIETGPGAIATGLVGSFVFGTAGYFGADWVADYIHEN